jgi:glucose-6-phosphate isomerase
MIFTVCIHPLSFVPDSHISQGMHTHLLLPYYQYLHKFADYFQQLRILTTPNPPQSRPSLPHRATWNPNLRQNPANASTTKLGSAHPIYTHTALTPSSAENLARSRHQWPTVIPQTHAPRHQSYSRRQLAQPPQPRPQPHIPPPRLRIVKCRVFEGNRPSDSIVFPLITPACSVRSFHPLL